MAMLKSSVVQGSLRVTDSTFTNSLTASDAITAKTLNITSTDGVSHITLSRDTYNYLSMPAGGELIFVSGATMGSAYGIRMKVINDPKVTGGYIVPGVTNKMTLGDSSLKWADVYATTFHGSLAASNITDTLGVAHGGTGAEFFTENSLIMSGSTTTAAFTTRAITDRTSAGALTNAATWADSTNIPTVNLIAYWDGRYQTTSDKSNLAYCKKGKFGDMATKTKGNGFSDSSDTISVAYGTSANTAVQGNQTIFTLNGSAKNSGSSASFYAPTSAGTKNQVLVSTGGAPGWKATANGAAYATSANGALTFGTLPIAQGGTGLTSSPSMLTNLGSTTAADILAASPRPGITGTLDIGHGGTGLTTAEPNKVLMGPSSGTDAAAPTWRTIVAADLPAASSSAAGITKVGASGGAAAYSHTHNYAGSSSAGGAATTAVTDADTADALYIVGVKSDATTDLKHDTLASLTGAVLTLGNSSTAGKVTLHDTSSTIGTLVTASLGATRTWTLPNASGTIALTKSNITGTAANVTGTVAIGHGGTGATTADDAWAALGGGESGKHDDSYFRLNTEPVSGAWFQGTPIVGNSGVMEIGKYLDFHASATATSDYDARIYANVNTTTGGGLVATDTLTINCNRTGHGNNSNGNAIVIREVKLVGSAQTSLDYAPKLAFLWSGKSAVSLALASNANKLSLYANATTDLAVFEAGQVWGAVWNDYAEFRKDNPNEKQRHKPGRCVYELGDGSLALTTMRLQPGCEIISDTYGFAIGQDKEKNYDTPLAVSGRVLAYGYESREDFTNNIGAPVCSGPNGTVSIMTPEEERAYPSRIIGTISEIPDYEIWGSGKVEVNGRIWIRVR